MCIHIDWVFKFIDRLVSVSLLNCCWFIHLRQHPYCDWEASNRKISLQTLSNSTMCNFIVHSDSPFAAHILTLLLSADYFAESCRELTVVSVFYRVIDCIFEKPTNKALISTLNNGISLRRWSQLFHWCFVLCLSSTAVISRTMSQSRNNTV